MSEYTYRVDKHGHIRKYKVVQEWKNKVRFWLVDGYARKTEYKQTKNQQHYDNLHDAELGAMSRLTELKGENLHQMHKIIKVQADNMRFIQSEKEKQDEL